MIADIDLNDYAQVRELLNVQLLSYSVEARLIGFHDIPGLRDTALSLQACGEQFFGCWQGEALAGAISFKEENGCIDIHRLVVHPDFFRRGIGERLVKHVLDTCKQRADRFIVATGAANLPAKRLYTKLGFVEQREVEVAPGFFIAEFEKIEETAAL
ncbi:acetyltransferase (GNAT) family protein [Paenibacillus taihuensis]|uniref:Acetyltransferase (GNAT) family protein n=1 Tax=Paenibacillus taihuensis TaxID=1156355 RepID=A0A3D9RJJ8_9BACL|nr:GNAT family N-acetyltransferase [Paenibacillus taihuensis]REE78957.1 acetyltransferase (GNAT) family protein [Paenibacillus taihuensis]